MAAKLSDKRKRLLKFLKENLPEEEVDAPVPPNLHTVLRDNPCEKDPCLICWLKPILLRDRATADAVDFSEEPFDVNIVGLRTAGSVSDAFDDRMVVFMKFVTATEKDAFEETIDGKQRDNLKKAAEHSKMRVISCSRKGAWLAAVFNITTDPGLGGTATEQLRKEIEETINIQKRLEEGLVYLKGEIEEKEKRGGKKGALQRMQRQTEKWLDGLPAEIQKLKTDLAATESGKLMTVQGPKVGKRNALLGVPAGRGMMTPGIYEKYRIGRHKSGVGPVQFKGAHIAVCIGETKAGYRFYQASHFRPNRLQGEQNPFNAKGEPRKGKWVLKDGKIKVGIHYPKSGDPVRYDEAHDEDAEEAVLGYKVENHGRKKTDYDVFLEVNGKRKPLADLDVLALRATTVKGTNLHRAHKRAWEKGEILPEKKGGGPSQWVGNWSEGCQTFPAVRDFNLFIQLVAASKRWRCQKDNPKIKDRSACRLIPFGSNDKKWDDEADEVLLKEYLEMGKDLEGERKKFLRLAELRDQPSVTVPVMEEKKEWRCSCGTFTGKKNKGKICPKCKDDDKKHHGKVTAHLTEVQAEIKKSKWSCSLDCGTLEGKKKKGKICPNCKGEVKEWVTREKKWITVTRAIFHERAAEFAWCGYRDCDLRHHNKNKDGKFCRQKIKYVLVEINKQEREKLDRLFDLKHSRVKEWDGELVLKEG